MANYKLSKSTMERYNIRIEGENNWRCAWAIISISEDGLFHVKSDCGDFSYSWGSFGDSFKAFLIRILNDSGYLYGKISDPAKDNMVNVEKTVANMKKRIIQNRREAGNFTPYLDCELSPDEARTLWDELTYLNNNHGDISQDAFASIFYHELSSYERSKVFSDEFWYEDILRFSPDIHAKTFCEVVAPVFRDILKSELEENKDD